MGIKKFTKFIRGLIPGTHHRFFFNDQDPRQIILVDGLGLVFTLFSETKRTLWGGIFADYKRFEEELNRWCDHFHNSGLDLVFYFDSSSGNPDGEAKLQELRRRKDQQIDAIIQLQDYCSGLADEIIEFLPNLIVHEALSLLKKKGVKVVHAIGEADQMLVRDGQSTLVFGVLSADSDILVASGIRCIPPDTIQLTQQGVECDYFLCTDVAQALDIPVDRLADLSILLGNDYSSHLWKQMQDAAKKKKTKQLTFLNNPFPHRGRVIEFVQKELKHVPLEHHKEFAEVMKEVPELQKAISFTRESLSGDSAWENTKARKNQQLIQQTREGRVPGRCLRIVNLHWDMLSVYPEFINDACPSIVAIVERAKASLYALLGVGEVLQHQRDGLAFSSKVIKTQHLTAKLKEVSAKRKPTAMMEIEMLLLDGNAQTVHACMKSKLLEYTSGVTLLYLIRSLSRLGDPLPLNEFDSLCLMAFMLNHNIDPSDKMEDKYDMKSVTLTTRYAASLEMIMELLQYQGLTLPAPHESFNGELLRYLYYHIGEAPYTDGELSAKVASILGNQQQVQSYLKLRKLLLKQEKDLISLPSSYSWRHLLNKNAITEQPKFKKETDIPSSSSSASTLNQQVLPIDQHKEKIVSAIECNPVVIIHGETGCGKSSKIPQFVHEELSDGRLIIVTQPHRMAAIALAKRVSAMMGEPLGHTVGYRIGQDKLGDKSKILFVTNGWLLMKLAHNVPYFQKVSHLILDEIHDRSIDSDLLYLLVKEMTLLNIKKSPTKLILMSATLNAPLFAKYLNKISKDIPVLFVGVKRFHVDKFFLESILDHPAMTETKLGFSRERISKMADKLDAVARKDGDLIMMVHRMCDALTKYHDDPQCILVFLPGIAEIQDLAQHFEKGQDPHEILILHSMIDHEDQMQVFTPLTHHRIVLATNIAESSVTIPNVKYVIDFGTCREIHVNAQFNCPALMLTWASKAAVEQRAGRTGRLFPGTVFRLYSKKFYDQIMPDYEIPEIQRNSLTDVTLRLLVLSRDVPKESPLSDAKAALYSTIQPPSEMKYQDAIHDLIKLNAIEEHPEKKGEYDVSPLGHLLHHLPMGCHMGKLVAYGCAFPTYLPHTIIMAAGLSMLDLYIQPNLAGKVEEFMEIFLRTETGHGKFSREGSDVIALIRMYTSNLGHKDLNKYGIHHRRYHQFRRLVSEISGRIDPKLFSKRVAQNLEILKSKQEEKFLRSILPLEDHDIFNLKLLLMMALGDNHYAFTGLGRQKGIKDKLTQFNLKKGVKERTVLIECAEGVNEEGLKEIFSFMWDQVETVKAVKKKRAVTFKKLNSEESGTYPLTNVNLRAFSRIFHQRGQITVPNPAVNMPPVGAKAKVPASLTLSHSSGHPNWSSIRGNSVVIDQSHLRYVKDMPHVGIMGTLMTTRGGMRMSRLTLMSMEDWTLGMSLIGGDFTLTSVGDRVTRYTNGKINFKLKKGIQVETILYLRNQVRSKLMECLRDPLKFTKSNLEHQISEIYKKYRTDQLSQSSQETHESGSEECQFKFEAISQPRLKDSLSEEETDSDTESIPIQNDAFVNESKQEVSDVEEDPQLEESDADVDFWEEIEDIQQVLDEIPSYLSQANSDSQSLFTLSQEDHDYSASQTFTDVASDEDHPSDHPSSEDEQVNSSDALSSEEDDEMTHNDDTFKLKTCHLSVKIPETGDLDDVLEYFQKWCQNCSVGATHIFLDCASPLDAGYLFNTGIQFEGKLLEISRRRCPEPRTCQSCQISQADDSSQILSSDETPTSDLRVVQSLVGTQKEIKNFFAGMKIRSKKNQTGKRIVSLVCRSIEHAVDVKSRVWFYRGQRLDLVFEAVKTPNLSDGESRQEKNQKRVADSLEEIPTSHLRVVQPVKSHKALRKLFEQQNVSFVTTNTNKNRQRMVYLNCSSPKIALQIKSKTWKCNDKVVNLELRPCPKPDTCLGCSKPSQNRETRSNSISSLPVIQNAEIDTENGRVEKVTTHLYVVGGIRGGNTVIRQIFSSSDLPHTMTIRMDMDGGVRSVVIHLSSMSAATAFKQKRWTYQGNTLQLEYQDCPQSGVCSSCAGPASQSLQHEFQVEPLIQLENETQIESVSSPIVEAISARQLIEQNSSSPTFSKPKNLRPEIQEHPTAHLRVVGPVAGSIRDFQKMTRSCQISSPQGTNSVHVTCRSIAHAVNIKQAKRLKKKNNSLQFAFEECPMPHSCIFCGSGKEEVEHPSTLTSDTFNMKFDATQEKNNLAEIDVLESISPQIHTKKIELSSQNSQDLIVQLKREKQEIQEAYQRAQQEVVRLQGDKKTNLAEIAELIEANSRSNLQNFGELKKMIAQMESLVQIKTETLTKENEELKFRVAQLEAKL